jgi:ribosomal protein S18 acetylase RimI-like enzyme
MRITRLNASQLDAAAGLLARAFYDSPVWAWIAPDPAHRLEVLPWFMRMRVGDALHECETHVAGEPGAGPGIAGVAIWEPPDRIDAEPRDDPASEATTSWAELPARMGDAAAARFNAMAEAQKPARERISRGEQAWYLSLLGVEPALQRSGIGASLLRHMLERADAGGVRTMTDTSKEANVPYYERHGFVVAESGTLPLGGPPFWIMRREPRH